MLATYGYRLRARRFLHELFMDSAFDEVITNFFIQWVYWQTTTYYLLPTTHSTASTKETFHAFNGVI